MRALALSEMIRVWEQGTSSSAVDQALFLLRAALPEASPESLAKLSIGQRDAHLLELREMTFGSWLTCRAFCPYCREDLRFEVEASRIRSDTPAAPSQPITGDVEGCHVRFRLPNSEDLLAAVNVQDAVAARSRILRRCVLEISQDGVERTLDELPDPLVEEISNLIGTAEPQADPQLAIDCPSCGHHWLAPFDIVNFLWGEISAWARRTLFDVHVLASAYGWSEADILEMSLARRQFYLEMVNA